MKPETGWISPILTGAGLCAQNRRKAGDAEAERGSAGRQEVAAANPAAI